MMIYLQIICMFNIIAILRRLFLRRGFTPFSTALSLIPAVNIGAISLNIIKSKFLDGP